MKIITKLPKSLRLLLWSTIGFTIFSVLMMLLLFLLLDGIWFKDFAFLAGFAYMIISFLLFLVYMIKKLFLPYEVEITEEKIIKKNLKSGACQTYKWRDMVRIKTGNYDTEHASKEYVWLYFKNGDKIFIEDDGKDPEYTKIFLPYREEILNNVRIHFPEAGTANP
ncbi:MAG: hypothetical protein K2X86_09440 [Cytophagaceae bacterium]|nr:hypothetical protein [Cytophagaceae bacterium]